MIISPEILEGVEWLPQTKGSSIPHVRNLNERVVSTNAGCVLSHKDLDIKIEVAFSENMLVNRQIAMKMFEAAILEMVKLKNK